MRIVSILCDKKKIFISFTCLLSFFLDISTSRSFIVYTHIVTRIPLNQPRNEKKRVLPHICLYKLSVECIIGFFSFLPPLFAFVVIVVEVRHTIAVYFSLNQNLYTYLKKKERLFYLNSFCFVSRACLSFLLFYLH